MYWPSVVNHRVDLDSGLLDGDRDVSTFAERQGGGGEVEVGVGVNVACFCSRVSYGGKASFHYTTIVIFPVARTKRAL